MTTDSPAPGSEGAEAPALPWFGPTLQELVPGLALGTRLPALRAQAARARSAAREDPVRQELVRRADQASRSPVAALVAEMLTPPLPRRHDNEERP
ncbi:hypothetical protein ABZ926_29215 [Streptomyces litmocidini]|uniref:hypothetical protein n=1 Tax=Streptomyces litmocidini TaxID=67318 RepID=UPI0033ECDAF5